MGVVKLLEVDPRKRITLEEAFEHPWLNCDGEREEGPRNHDLSDGTYVKEDVTRRVCTENNSQHFYHYHHHNRPHQQQNNIISHDPVRHNQIEHIPISYDNVRKDAIEVVL